MAVVAAVEEYRVTINGIDLTVAVDAKINAGGSDLWFTASEPGPSPEGIGPVEGELLLAPALGFDSDFFNPRKNRKLWRRGNTVLIELKVGGVWRTHPRGNLYILRKPATPSINRTESSNSLSVPVGCEIALRLQDAPAGDQSGVTIGSDNTRTDIISNLATAANMSATWSGSIAKYPIPYPVPKRDGVAWLELVGEVAAAAGYQVYVDPSGNLNASELSLNPSSINTYHWRDLIEIEAVDGEEAVETVKAVLLGQTVEETPLTRADTFTEEGVIVNLITNFGGDQLITGTKKQTTITETWSSDYKTRTVTETVKEPWSNITGGNVSVSPLQIRYVKTVVEIYSSSIDGKLLKRTTTIWGQPDQFVFTLLTLEAGGTAPAPQKLSTEVEAWSYNGEVVSTYTLTRDATRFNVVSFGTSTVSTSERRTRERTVTWQNLGGETWRQIIDNRENIYPTTLDLVSTGDSGIRTASDGSTAPRAPQRHSPSHIREEIVYEGEALFPDAALDDEPKVYDFGPYGVSNDQAEFLANLWGGYDWGQAEGYQMIVPLNFSHWSYRPGAGVKVTLPDGDKILAGLGATAWELAGNRATVGHQLIPLGTLATGDALVTPYPVKLGGSGVMKCLADEGLVFQETAGIEDVDPFGIMTCQVDPGFIDTGGGVSIEGSEGIMRCQVVVDTQAQPTALSIERGGTGANSAVEALKNLGIYVLAGDLSGNILNPQLRATGVTPGTYTSVTVDAKGRVTAGTA